MAAIGALAAGEILRAGVDAYGQYQQRKDQNAADAENWNNYVDILNQRRATGQQMGDLYDFMSPTEMVQDEQGNWVPGNYQTNDLGRAFEGLQGANQDAYTYGTYGLENALGQLGAIPGAVGDAFNAYGGAAQDVAGSYLQQAGNALNPAIGMSRYADQAAQGVNPYDLVGAYDQRMQNWQEDPGYQSRVKAGEDAIMRRAAASGGRMSGATLQALMEHGQQQASQEYGNIAARNMGLLGQQAGATDRANLATQQIQYGLGGQGLGAMRDLAGMYGQTGGSLSNLLGGYGGQMGNVVNDVGGRAAATTMSGYGNLGDIVRSGAGGLWDAIYGIQGNKANALGFEYGGPSMPQQGGGNVGEIWSRAAGGLGNTLGLLGAYGMRGGFGGEDSQPVDYEDY